MIAVSFTSFLFAPSLLVLPMPLQVPFFAGIVNGLTGVL